MCMIDGKTIVAVILARAGSKGLPNKCIVPVLGKPMIAYTFEHSKAAKTLDGIVLTTDSPEAAALAGQYGVEVVNRPAPLASDKARVDESVRHAVLQYEARHSRRVDAAVILYGNIPVRAPGAIDRAAENLVRCGGDSVRTVAPVGKMHPDWMHKLDGDKMIQYRPNSIHRRQELEPVYYHDGAVIAVTREALFDASTAGSDPHAFFGKDRRAIVQGPHDAVDIDEPLDVLVAEAVLRHGMGRHLAS
jgi:CMP-N,N'-diacetyllegionaminic acid synthase